MQAMRFSPPAASLLPLRRPGLFGAFGQRHRLLLCCLSQPPFELPGNILLAAAGDQAVFDDIVEILTGDEHLRPATGDLLQARLLGNYVAEGEPGAVRDLNERADFSQELRCRGVDTLLPRRTLGAEVLRLLIEVLAEKKCQEERRGDLVPPLDAGIDAGEHLAETGVGEAFAFGVE